MAAIELLIDGAGGPSAPSLLLNDWFHFSDATLQSVMRRLMMGEPRKNCPRATRCRRR